MLSTAGLDLIVRGFAHTVGTTAGLMAVADKAGELVRVLSAWGDAMALDDLPTSLTGGLVGRAFGFERAVLEPLWSEDGLSGLRSSLRPGTPRPSDWPSGCGPPSTRAPRRRGAGQRRCAGRIRADAVEQR